MLYKEKKPVESKAELEASLKHDPENTQAYYYLGKLQKESHDYIAALLSFEKAQRNPEFKAKALVEARRLLHEHGRHGKSDPRAGARAVKVANDDGSSEALYGRYFLAMCYEKTAGSR